MPQIRKHVRRFEEEEMPRARTLSDIAEEEEKLAAVERKVFEVAQEYADDLLGMEKGGSRVFSGLKFVCIDAVNEVEPGADWENYYGRDFKVNGFVVEIGYKPKWDEPEISVSVDKNATS